MLRWQDNKAGQDTLLGLAARASLLEASGFLMLLKLRGHIRHWTVPMFVTHDLGSRATFALSTTG